MLSLGSFPKVGQKQKTEKKEREREKEREKEQKLVITMASYVLQTPPRVAHTKPPGPKTKSVKTLASYACNRHQGWRMQAAWTNNGQLHS